MSGSFDAVRCSVALTHRIYKHDKDSPRTHILLLLRMAFDDPELGLGNAFRHTGDDRFLGESDPLRIFAHGAVQREAPGTLVLMLVGKCGAGKSSTANNLLGKPLFESKRSASSVTQQCQIGTAEVQVPSSQVPVGTPLVVVDTPGLGDPHTTLQVLCAEMRSTMDAIEKCFKTVGAEVRFANVLVLGVHGRITDDDLQAIQALKYVFGWRYLSSTIVVWTHGDLLDAGGLDAHLADANEDIKSMLASMGPGQSAVLDNRSSADCELQAAQLAVVFNAASAVSGPLTRPRGKAVRKLRQAAMRAEQQNLKSTESEEKVHTWRPCAVL